MQEGPRRPSRPRLDPFGKWLTETRISLGLRMSDVAAYLKCNQGRIYEYEMGKPIKPDHWQKIRNLFSRESRKRH